MIRERPEHGLRLIDEDDNKYLITREDITREQFVKFLSNTLTKIDLVEFERLSAKTIADAYEEVSGRDVVFTYSLRDGKVRRIASSAKVLFTRGARQMLETKRVLPTGAELVHETPKTFTVSETLKRGELPRDAAFRGIREEFGSAFIRRYRLSPEMLQEMALPIEERISAHASSVYFGVLSCVSVSAFHLEFPTSGPFPYRRGHVAHERDEMEIHTKWYG